MDYICRFKVPLLPVLAVSLALSAGFVLGMHELSLQYQRSIDAQWHYSQLQAQRLMAELQGKQAAGIEKE